MACTPALLLFQVGLFQMKKWRAIQLLRAGKSLWCYGLLLCPGRWQGAERYQQQPDCFDS
ncbi:MULTISPECIES: hypothetical protein [Dickeya]|uniref:hypothetical protein n=1 Tax=Dickeya TaxID=204037 RepID=UPI0004F7F6E9|nr:MULTISPECIES: hypothetical protein [Dickeya]AIR70943.1 hypothetical protein LH89_17630 [Dickeya fangzhongdai]KGT97135.1 hypothetical protein NM75_16300 [Dickeya fangzhongdai]MBO8133879.1 hypothetical protein [Dickeya fangzhongdai]WPD75055.1 hypothetical protein OGM23_18230 [Dickeya fangzhongdai]